MNNFNVGLLQKLAVNKAPAKLPPIKPFNPPEIPPVKMELPKDHIAENKRLEDLLMEDMIMNPPKTTKPKNPYMPIEPYIGRR